MCVPARVLLRSTYMSATGSKLFIFLSLILP